MTAIVLPADLKRWAVKHLREQLGKMGHDVSIDTKTPKTMSYPLTKPLITGNGIRNSPSTSAPEPAKTIKSATTSHA